jgi:hypothetical protein
VRRSLALSFIVGLWLTAHGSQLAAVYAEETSSEYLLQMTRVDFLMRRQKFQQAAEELGRIPHDQQSDPLFRRYAGRIMEKLSESIRKASAVGTGRRKAPDTLHQRLRVTRRKVDSESGSDRNSDNRGWQVNERLEADVRGRDGIRAKFQADLDGYRNGHNDVRYRTLLADFYRGKNHVAFGDTATYTSPYFLRSSRLRGVHVLLDGDLNEFQALAGAYPYWLEDRDAYIYPRTVFGIRDRYRLMEDRVRIGANLVQTRDTGKIRAIDTVNQPRDNWVWSLDQELKLIPDTWFIKAAEAYSTTDDRLEEDRFGETTKLKDTSFQVESLFIRPGSRWTSRFERTGPDFRLLTDLPSGSALNSKGLTSDRQRVEQEIDFNPVGPFDLDLSGSWMRNNLDSDDTVEMTRQAFYTANLGILTPAGFPKPRLRGTLIDTVSSPGPTTRPGQSRLFDLRGEVSHRYEGVYGTFFTEWEAEVPQEDKNLYSPEEKWNFGTRLSTTLLGRILVSPRYTYRITDEDFDVSTIDRQITEIRTKARHHEAGLSTSTRLWSNASVGLGYTYFSGKLAHPDNSGPLIPTEAHTGTASFLWPFSHTSWNKREKWTAFPSVHFYLADLRNGLEKRPSVSSRMTLGYELLHQWRVELMGELHRDEDRKYTDVRTEEARLWLLWTAEWQ